MGSNAPTPLATTTIKTTEDAIKFFRLLRAGCRLRGIEWWLNDALEEFPSVNARAAAIRALDKAMRIDQLMEQNFDTALAPNVGQSNFFLAHTLSLFLPPSNTRYFASSSSFICTKRPHCQAVWARIRPP
jgi:hypothetical protein